MKSYISLHTHTVYSVLDGFSKIPALVKKAKEYEMPALAITDHGVCSGWIEFLNETKSQGIKPIYGCELYMVDDINLTTIQTKGSKVTEVRDRSNYHITLLAMNKTGYENIKKLSSIASLEGFYYKPRVDWNILRQHSAGIIAMSGCMAGYLPQIILKANRNGTDPEVEFMRILNKYREIFGDNFYFEVQDNKIDEQYDINDYFVDIATKVGLKTVGTLDTHYVDKDDAYYHDMLMCVQTKTFYDQKDRMMYGRWEGDKIIYHPFHLRAPEEFYKIGEELGWGNAVEETLKIAEQCDVDLKFQVAMPSVGIPEEYAGDEGVYLEQLARHGFFERGLDKLSNSKKYKERLKFELDVIKKSGYSAYFLIIYDYIKECRKQGVYFGFGRGSAAGSLVTYCLRITDVDPIEFNLLFERFLNPDRISLPDIDTDVSDRDLVVRYLTNKYGADKVAAICNFSTIKSKQAIQDICRVLRHPFDESVKMSKCIPNEYNINDLENDLRLATKDEESVNTLLEKEEIRSKREFVKANREMFTYFNQYPEIFEIAKKITGSIRGISTHAAGIVIAPGPLTDYCPLMKDKSGNIQTQWDMHGVEEAGLVKLDNLGLKTLNVVKTTIELVKNTKGVELNYYEIPRKDKEVLKTIHEEQPLGLFQVEAAGAQKISRAVEYQSIAELGIALALNRPGPIDSGITQQYINRHSGKEMATPLYPGVDIFESANNNLIIFQEDIMQLARHFGFTGGEADTLRKGIGKKKMELLEEMKPKFLEGAQKEGLSEAQAKELFDKVQAFGAYAFNKSHSTAYAHLTYTTAWLRKYYPVEFMTALLTWENDNDKVSDYIMGAIGLGINIITPDVNKSNVSFGTDGKTISFGFSVIKGIGEGTAEEIMSHRPYDSIVDFLMKVDNKKVTKKHLKLLAQTGAFLSICSSRKAIANNIETLNEFVREYKKIKEKPPTKSAKSNKVREDKLKEIEEKFGKWRINEKKDNLSEYTKREIIEIEKELMGQSITLDELDLDFKDDETFRSFMLKANAVDSFGLIEAVDKAKLITGGVVKNIISPTVKKEGAWQGRKLSIVTLGDVSGRGTVELFLSPDAAEGLPQLTIGDIILVQGWKYKEQIRLTRWSRDGDITGKIRILYKCCDTNQTR